MQNHTPFQVYNASAGSGKTFTLVKEYLKVLLSSSDVFRFQKILAITFTNKAAGEMKERVMKNLRTFSEGKETDMYPMILKEAEIDSAIIQERSTRILDAILKNYSAFSITTIDSFTHKIIKSFAHDLGLTLNFEVEMDANALLGEAVDVLLSKIGTDEELTKLLIDFSASKIDNDKSWDISRELNEFSSILHNEDDVKHFRNLSNKTITEFFALQDKLQKANQKIENSFKEIGEKALELVNQNGLKFTDFAYAGECPNHFKKLMTYKLSSSTINFEGRLNGVFENDKNLFGGKASPEVKQVIEGVYDQLKSFYLQSKSLYEKSSSLYITNKLALKSIIPLAVLNKINTELQTIKDDNNIRLNAEFNQLISDNIQDQPAPFIYERIGQKFMHYFIDEMQDTSVLQWQNLVPLIDNALAQEKSNLLLVGDGKQAIYRWRGGKAEQFIDLGLEDESKNPFSIPKQVSELETNFRSYSEIIGFNNQFFQHTSKFLNNPIYKQLFVDGNKQKENAKEGGFVTLNFLEKEEDKEDDKIKYPKNILAKIRELEHQYSLNEICVLVRKKKDGVAVANYLSEHNVAIVSSETLLLSNSPKVNFIIDFLQVIQNPNDEEMRFEVLYFLREHLKIEKEKHSLFNSLVKEQLKVFFEGLAEYDIYFNVDLFQQLPFYEKIEEIIRSFNLVETSDAYVQFFLDVVVDQQRKGTGVQEFLDFWNVKKDKLSIVSSEDSDAVQIMTIHKSKGLEFPVVIFAYDLEIYRQINPKVWFNDLPEDYKGFSELLIDYNKELSLINETGVRLYDKQQEELELDNFNLLYVALTRPVEQLHIFTDKRVNKNGEESLRNYSGIFINYLKEQNQWVNDKLVYEFGENNRKSLKEECVNNNTQQEVFVSESWKNHNISMLASSSKLWGAEEKEAIDYGNFIHETLAKIKSTKDVEFVLKDLQDKGELSDKDLMLLKEKVLKVVNHPELKEFFIEGLKVFNEREIVCDNKIIIPDRLIVEENGVTIIDYKTGKQSVKHENQLLNYADVLKELGFVVKKKVLIYINEDVFVVLF